VKFLAATRGREVIVPARRRGTSRPDNRVLAKYDVPYGATPSFGQGGGRPGEII
jgi:hypothetical protein